MKLYYRNINDIIYVYKGKLNYKLERHNKKLTKELIQKHDKSYVDYTYLDNLPCDLVKSYYILYKYNLPCNKWSEKDCGI